MAFFDYNRDGKKDWKDNAREYGIITIDRISKEKILLHGIRSNDSP